RGAWTGSAVPGSLLTGPIRLLRRPPPWTETSRVLPEPQSEKVPGPSALRADTNLDLAMIESQMAIIRSTVFLRRVVEKERLVTDPEFGSSGSSGPSILATVRPAGEAQSMSAEVLSATEALKGAVSVATGSGYVLAISVTSTDPIRAARLSNAVAAIYLLAKLRSRFYAA